MNWRAGGWLLPSASPLGRLLFVSMPRKARVCRACGAPIPPGTGTRSGYCSVNCSIPVALEAARQMRAKSGPHYDHWVARMTQIHGHPPKDRG